MGRIFTTETQRFIKRINRDEGDGQGYKTNYLKYPFDLLHPC
jgi:hypothetical protein